MSRAIYKGKAYDPDGHSVHLFYEYRGKEYIITDEHNGYSETLFEKHQYEQQRIDELLDGTPSENHPSKSVDGFSLEEIFQMMGWD